MYTYYPMSAPNSTPNPRKRPAPGSIPMPQQIPQNYTPDQLLRWNGNNMGSFVDNGSNAVNPYGMVPSVSSPQQAQYPQNLQAQSTALARRGVNNNALVPANRTFNPQQQPQQQQPQQQQQQQQSELWPNFTDDTMSLNTPTGGPTLDEHDNIELLEERAQRAKRDAQAKRKQIPPFVQKLNSFLEESKNTDLIRWSEKGDSFIVLDEDEFAKTLIPELFKHNNYASFVRQLNMYGFHKKVGLSDNSMKASERKNKSPSEYYNPYFRRGHPNLLWLINKPKSGNSKKTNKKRPDEPEADSDDEGVVVDDTLGPNFPQHNSATRALPAPDTGGPLQKKELAVVRDQMAALQAQQKTISAAITHLRQEHNELYRQALAFQTQHDRHENSINAILNFLANVFRKSLEEQGGVQNVTELLASILPNAQMPQTQQSGTVVDLSDWTPQQGPEPTTQVGTPKRPQRLLTGIPQSQPKRSASNTPNPSAFPNPTHNHAQPRMGSVTELVDTPSEAATPAYLKHELEANPQEGMMRLIQNANTKSQGSPTPFADVAAQTPPTMTSDQRERMLSIMSSGTNSASPQAAPGYRVTTPGVATAGRSGSPGTNAAPMAGASSNGTMPAMPNNSMTAAAGTTASLSPMLSSPSIIPPSMQRIAQTQEDLQKLQRLQEEQNNKIEALNSLLAPLSPSGRVPGIEDHGAHNGGGGGGYFANGADADVDLTQFLDASAYADPAADFDFDAASGGGVHGFDSATANYDWGAGAHDTGIDFGASPGMSGGFVGSGAGGIGVGGGGGGGVGLLDADRIVETNTTASSNHSPSTTNTEEIPRDDLLNDYDSPGRSNKRQRKA